VLVCFVSSIIVKKWLIPVFHFGRRLAPVTMPDPIYAPAARTVNANRFKKDALQEAFDELYSIRQRRTSAKHLRAECTRQAKAPSQKRLFTITMSGNHRRKMPAYKKIQGEIRDRIASARLKPGDAVASERELAKIHDVSLMTARHALAGLEQEGIVERRLGAGTFVAVPKIHFNKLMSYTEQMSSRGLAPRSRVLVSKVVDGELEVVARLGLAAGSRLIKIQRLRLTGEDPFALETCYLPADDFPELESTPLVRGSLFAVLEHDYRTKLAYADEEVDATSADASVASMLSVPKGSSLLRIRQTIYSAKGKATIYVVGLYRSERHTLFIRRLR
jgi:GntR family transcriptional regulator